VASRRYVPPKRRVQLYGLHGVISQKMILFITTAVKASNPAYIGDVDVDGTLIVKWMLKT
jgi:hypothetical protein